MNALAEKNNAGLATTPSEGASGSIQRAAAVRVAVVTNFPAHNQVDVFNELAKRPELELKVFYLRKLTPGRQWRTLRTIQHGHEFVREWRIHQHFYLNPGLLMRILRFRPSLVILTQYASIGMQLLMYLCAVLRIPFVLWSEAPGVRFSELPPITNERLRRAGRSLALLPVRCFPREIWGVGRRACEAYERVTTIPCRNVPYYLDQSWCRAIRRTGAGHPIRFLYAGKLIRRKGIDKLLEATCALVRQGHDCRVVVVGDGPDRHLLDKLTRDERRHVEYLGFKELADLPAVFERADVLVFPSRYDGWGLAVIEALASGIPVIGSNAAGATVDAVVDEVNGFVVPPEDSAAIASSMRRFVLDPELVCRFGDMARQSARRYEATVGAAVIADAILRLAASVRAERR